MPDLQKFSFTKLFVATLFCNFSTFVYSQNSSLSGQIVDASGSPVAYANLFLFFQKDTSLAKVELSDETGKFAFSEIKDGDYFLKISYVGMQELQRGNLSILKNEPKDLGTLTLMPSSTQLQETVISAKRTLLEVKPDRTIFNVEGTINSIGNDGISLLRKAPGVNVDNNDNISLLGRSGVLVYVDGKRIPLSGQELANYLQSLQAEQIDRIEIISNPGAKYEAQGNAGIIDIRLKRDSNFGTNGTTSLSYIQGRFPKFTLSGAANYRNKKWNVFGNTSLISWKGFNQMSFQSYQNDLYLDESVYNKVLRKSINYRVGADYFLSKSHTLGVLASGSFATGDHPGLNRIELSQASKPLEIDSILVANTLTDAPRMNQTYNINYRYDAGKGHKFNVDLDYGFFENKNLRDQVNQYFDPNEQDILNSSVISFNTPSDIDIWTFKSDYEQPLLGGNLGGGVKLSHVNSKNTFHVFDQLNQQGMLNLRRSNFFEYDEKVYAAYLSYQHSLGKNWNYGLGLRLEQSDILGSLLTYLPELQEPPVDLEYLSWFPNISLSWNASPDNAFQWSYSRRINRPDYQVLNPFVNQLSELSFEKGNAFLDPEIVNNYEMSYTLKYRFNFKLGYSLTTDQITRLIGPDDSDPRASFINWDNLAERRTFNFSASLPFQFAKNLESYFNLGASHIHNLADYGNGAKVDLKAFTYSIYQQHSYALPAGWQAEISGYFSGPGIWGGVFVYETSWSLDIGLQKKFFNDRLTFKISGNDIFYESGWSGESNFDGLKSYGTGKWDSKRLTINLSYKFGNDNVKSRRRTTGLEDEAGRVGNGD